MDLALDARQPWEKKAQRIYKWVAGGTTIGLMLTLAVLDVESATRLVAYGILASILALVSFAIMTFPGSTGMLQQPVSPFPRFAIGMGLLVTGAGLALLGTGNSLGPATIIFGPILILVGAGELTRRRYISNKEATA